MNYEIITEIDGKRLPEATVFDWNTKSQPILRIEVGVAYYENKDEITHQVLAIPVHNEGLFAKDSSALEWLNEYEATFNEGFNWSYNDAESLAEWAKNYLEEKCGKNVYFIDYVDDYDVYPLLRPLSDLQEMAKNGELKNSPVDVSTFFDGKRYNAKTGQYNYRGEWVDLGGEFSDMIVMPWNARQLRWLRDNGFCSANFKFANEVQHARLIK